MKSRAARTTMGIVVGGALIAGGAVFASTASAGEEAAPAAAKALSPAASKNPQQLAHNAAALLGTQQRALSVKQFQAGQTPVAEPLLAPAAAPKAAALTPAADPKLADDPTDVTAPTGSYKMSLPSVWIGQRLTLTELGVSDDVSASENISRTVNWGDGSTTVLVPGSAPIGKRYYAAGKYTVSVTLTDEAGNSGTAAVTNAVVTTTKPGVFKISPTSVFNYQRFTLAISGVPAGTTKINVTWGDGYGSSLAGKNQTIGKRYYVRSNGTLVTSGTMTLTATFTNKNGATSAFVIGKVINKRDLTRPVIKFTRPKNPSRVSSWSTIRGTATDSGSGIVGNKIAILPVRESTSHNLYCYTPGKRWLLTDDNFTGCAGTLVTVSKGKWSMKLPGLAKGAVLIVGKTYDYSDNTTNDDTTFIYQDLTAS